MTMHLQSRAFDAYGRAASTLPPLEQIVMLYDAAIRRVQQAEAACAEGRIEDRFSATGKAMAIIDALQACLDFELGGEVATALDRYYTQLSLQLARVNVTNDPELCARIVDQLREVRASWAALAGGAAAGNTAEAPSPTALAGSF